MENSACHVQRVQNLGFGHFLRGWNFAPDLIVLCVIRSYLPTKCNSIGTVSVIKLSCVVTRQFSRPWKSNTQIHVIVYVGLQLCIDRRLVLSSLKMVLFRISVERIFPNLEDVPSNKRDHICFQCEPAHPRLSLAFKYFINNHFPGLWFRSGSPKN